MGRPKKTWKQYRDSMLKIHKHYFTYPDNVVLSDGNKTKIEILCPKHGAFYQNINNHLRQYGCPSCGRELKSKYSKITVGEFYSLAVAKYGLQYKYRGIDHSITRVSTIQVLHITCGKEFTTTVAKHLNNYRGGCSFCLDIGEPYKTDLPNITLEDIKNY